DYRRKCDAVEEAYKAKKEKELAIMQCKEPEFLRRCRQQNEPSLKGNKLK
ncbi:hypothetical protein Tco_1161855, partial [Tanacetum coccineum]